MPRVSQDVLAAVKDAFEQYQKEVEAPHVAPQTKRSYIKSAVQFVHWMEGRFQPGKTLKRGLER